MLKSEIMSAIELLLDEGIMDNEWFDFEEIERAIQEAQYRVINQLVTKSDERGLRTAYRYSMMSSYDKPGYDRNIDWVDGPDASGYAIMYPRGLWVSGNGTPSGTYSGVYNCSYIDTNQIQQHDDYRLSGQRTLGAYYSVLHSHVSGVEEPRVYFTDPTHKNTATLFYVVKPKDFIVSGTLPSGISGEAYTGSLLLPNEYHHKIIFTAAEILNNRDVMEYERANIAVREMGMINKFEEMADD